jgi:signal transduction histidine kinase
MDTSQNAQVSFFQTGEFVTAAVLSPAEFPPSLARATGVAADTMRAVDWSRSVIGQPDQWPPTLVSTLAMILHSRHPMFLFWGPHLISFYNDAYLPSFGVGKHPGAMGQPGAELWPEIWPIIGPQIDDVMLGAKASWNVDQLVPIFRNGSIEEVYWTYGYSPVFDPGGEVVATLVVCTETTARVFAERSLVEAHRQAEQARRELHDFLMQAPIGICMLEGPQHRFTLANQTYLSLLFGGRQESEFLGKSVREIVPEVESQGFMQLLDRVYQVGEPFDGAKMPIFLTQSDGSLKELFINFTYRPKRDAEGNTTGILAIVYEVTDQVNENKEIALLAQNLQKAITARDTFLGIASHELKTPLTSLKLHMQMSQRLLDAKGPQAFSGEKIGRLISNTKTQADRLSRLVDDMLDISRISSGKLAMDIAPTDVSQLLGETLERFEPQLAAVHSVLTTDIPAGLVAAADAYRIEQVMTNLLGNALKYAPGAPVHVRAVAKTDRVLFTVRDEGAGIAAEDQKRIFERFERAVPSSHTSGLGLGLHISRQIVEAHHGQLRVTSVPGEGATFSFDLPLAEASR